MPFPKGKSPKDIAKKVNAKIDHIVNDQLEAALTAVIYAVGGNADFYVPVDTNALMNSRETHVVPHEDGYRATLGYYQNYALALPGWIFRGVAETDIKGMFAEAMRI